MSWNPYFIFIIIIIIIITIIIIIIIIITGYGPQSPSRRRFRMRRPPRGSKKALIPRYALGQSSVLLRRVVIKTVGLVDLIEMRKTECFVETRLVPYVPSSFELESEFMTIIIIIIIFHDYYDYYYNYYQSY